MLGMRDKMKVEVASDVWQDVLNVPRSVREGLQEAAALKSKASWAMKNLAWRVEEVEIGLAKRMWVLP